MLLKLYFRQEVMPALGTGVDLWYVPFHPRQPLWCKLEWSVGEWGVELHQEFTQISASSVNGSLITLTGKLLSFLFETIQVLILYLNLRC